MAEFDTGLTQVLKIKMEAPEDTAEYTVSGKGLGLESAAWAVERQVQETQGAGDTPNMEYYGYKRLTLPDITLYANDELYKRFRRGGTKRGTVTLQPEGGAVGSRQIKETFLIQSRFQYPPDNVVLLILSLSLDSDPSNAVGVVPAP